MGSTASLEPINLTNFAFVTALKVHTILVATTNDNGYRKMDNLMLLYIILM